MELSVHNPLSGLNRCRLGLLLIGNNAGRYLIKTSYICQICQNRIYIGSRLSPQSSLISPNTLIVSYSCLVSVRESFSSCFNICTRVRA